MGDKVGDLLEGVMRPQGMKKKKKERKKHVN